MSLRPVRCGVAAASLCIAVAASSTAQQQTATTNRSGWLARRTEIGGGLTAGQRAAALAKLEQIERILLQIPELARPQGFELMPQYYGGARQLGPGGVEQPGHVTEYKLLLYFFAPSKAVAGEGCACITIEVNRHTPVGAEAFRDEQGREIYVEAQRGDPLPLATQVYHALSHKRERSSVSVLLTSGAEPPWKTVTRQEYYHAVIFDTEGRQGANLADFRKSLTRTPYQDWIGGAAERKEQREQTLSSAARYQTQAEVEKLRQTLETTEREVTQKLKASEVTDRVANQKALALSHARTDTMRAELNAMSTAERNMPALIDMTLAEGPMTAGWRLTNVDSPRARRVLTPDYNFLRARKSPVEVRSITVSITATGTGLDHAVHKVLLQTFETLDWAAPQTSGRPPITAKHDETHRSVCPCTHQLAESSARAGKGRSTTGPDRVELYADQPRVDGRTNRR